MRRILLVLALLAVAVPVAVQASELRAFGRDGWSQIAAAHAGRPLVVHFWSLSCAPCMAELPRWGERAAGPRRYDLVLVATDPIAEAPRLLAALERAGLGGTENWAFAERFAAKLRYGVDPEWQGELPMTRLVAADGHGETVLGGLEAADLQRWETSLAR